MTREEKGFTLIELMIALLIFGMLAAAGVSLLSFSIKAQAGSKMRLEDVAEVRRLFVMLSQDLAQAVPRTTRGQGGEQEAAFIGGDASRTLSYVRAGVSSSLDRPSSTLQRVDWAIANGTLQRTARPMVDGGADLDPAIIVTAIEKISIRFREKGEWRDRWTPTNPRELPRAVELTFERKGSAPITQLFLVGTGR